MDKVIALDIGGTQSRAALFEDERIAWRAVVPTPGQQGPQAMLDAVVDMLGSVRTHDAKVGVAIAGQVAGGRVTAHNDALLRGWNAWPLQQALAARLDRDVCVINDARAAAWGEYCSGSGQGCTEFAFVTVSTGIGAGLVLGGRLHLAGNGMDAELGEVLVDDDGLTLENLACGTALGKLAARHGYVDARGLFDAADAGDERAELLVREGVRVLARKLAGLAVLLGITRCAVGGGVGLRPGYIERLRQELHRLPALYHHEIIPARLGGDAGLHGVAAWVRDQSPPAPEG